MRAWAGAIICLLLVSSLHSPSTLAAAELPWDLQPGLIALHNASVVAISAVETTDDPLEGPSERWFVAAYRGGAEDLLVGDEVRLVLLKRHRPSLEGMAPFWEHVADVRLPEDALTLELFPTPSGNSSIVKLRAEVEGVGVVALDFVGTPPGRGGHVTLPNYVIEAEANGGEVWDSMIGWVEGTIDGNEYVEGDVGTWGYNVSGIVYQFGPL